MPRALMRRHVPLASPNCTRVFGPMDATRRESRLGAARTTTQPLATELTQRADGADFVGAAVVGGLGGSATDGAATTLGAGVGMTGSIAATGGEDCATTFPAETV